MNTLNSKPPKYKDLIGKKFGRILITDVVGRQKGHMKWKGVCDCGQEVTPFGSSLLQGKTVSCGCFGRERVKETHTTHGQTANYKHTTEYRIYAGAKDRCTNPNRKEYSRYGGRGIQFLFTSFTEFLEALGRRPSKDYSLERIDNDGPYSPQNCKWATRHEQQNNTTRTRTITAWGRSQTLAEWAATLGVSAHTVRSRIDRSGWCNECAVSFGNVKSLRHICTHC